MYEYGYVYYLSAFDIDVTKVAFSIKPFTIQFQANSKCCYKRVLVIK